MAAAGCVLWSYSVYFKPRAAFKELLGGSNSVHISSLIIRGQDRMVTLNDPDVAQYLTQALRFSQRHAYRPGITYEAEIRLAAGGGIHCGVFIPKEKGLITISFPLDGTTTYYYLVTLPVPIPAALERTLSSLRAPTLR
jgi:hypothetical protein